MHFRNQHTNDTDEELILRYRSTGDTEWLGILLKRYTTLLFGVAMKYLKNTMQAEDAVQQVFLKVLTGMPAGPIANFKGWLYVLIKNHCLNELRNHKHELITVDTDTTAEEIPEAQEGTQFAADTIFNALALLNEQQKKCITLFYFQKQHYEQIMSATGYTFTEVKSHIQNGRRNLKNLLIKHSKTGILGK